MSNISRGRRPSHSPFRRYGGHFEFYCFKYLLWDAQGANLLLVYLRDFSAVEREDNIVCCLRFMLKLSRETKSAAASIARSNDSPCTRADLPTKKSSSFEHQKLHVIATPFVNYFH